mmetsp:Transcript_50640/g.162883  ORF Transcript_50640/g.162883 Transcript_50640/m.162883 type:complete len:343 (-) Transcript_50640:212-1240(-)
MCQNYSAPRHPRPRPLRQRWPFFSLGLTDCLTRQETRAGEPAAGVVRAASRAACGSRSVGLHVLRVERKASHESDRAWVESGHHTHRSVAGGLVLVGLRVRLVEGVGHFAVAQEACEGEGRHRLVAEHLPIVDVDDGRDLIGPVAASAVLVDEGALRRIWRHRAQKLLVAIEPPGWTAAAGAGAHAMRGPAGRQVVVGHKVMAVETDRMAAKGAIVREARNVLGGRELHEGTSLGRRLVALKKLPLRVGGAGVEDLAGAGEGLALRGRDDEEVHVQMGHTVSAGALAVELAAVPRRVPTCAECQEGVLVGIAAGRGHDGHLEAGRKRCEVLPCVRVRLDIEL